MADARASGAQPGGELSPGDPLPYRVTIDVNGDAPGLENKMRALSQLVELEKEPPDSMLGIERRARADAETAERLMQSQCYYDGVASYRLDDKSKPVTARLILKPGARYHLGRARVSYEPAPFIPDFFVSRTRRTGFFNDTLEKIPGPEFPRTVPGLELGAPVAAEAVLDAVNALPGELQRRGYPYARISESRYTLDRLKKELNADIVVDPGKPAIMGPVLVHGSKEVNPGYIERLVPWQPGAIPWNSVLLENYANTLRGLGLFRTVEAAPALAEEEKVLKDHQEIALLPAEITVEEAPFRSLSASARYDTDTGLGLEGEWEHRNLFHNGEKLNLVAPISTEELGLKAFFEKPAFLVRQQKLLAKAALLRQNTSAYQQTSLRGEFGLERRFGRRWSGAMSIYGEGGTLKDNENSENSYSMLSPRASLRYDSRNNSMNPSSGMEARVQLKPFSGYYNEQFSTFAGTAAASFYYAPLKEKNGGPDDRLVLAARIEGGGMAGSSLEAIPSSLRYFVGGAGTVRGYPYQAIGPRDNEDDPKGGRSYQVINLETRFRVGENLGIVPFLDGGMVYKEEIPRIFGDMNWGAGLGLRYFTPIGPVRLDVATPLNYIKDDPPVQVYLSIGQSF